MNLFDRPLTISEIDRLQKEWGDYLKVTADLKNGWLVAGGELLADGEKILLEKGGKQENVWGGAVNLKDKIIDTSAVLNLRPRLKNDNIEILDPVKRKKFIDLVEAYFKPLWD